MGGPRSPTLVSAPSEGTGTDRGAARTRGARSPRQPTPRTRQRPRLPARRALIFAIVITALIGSITELGQAFVPGRDASLFDLFANWIGAVLGAGLVHWVRKR